MKKYIEKNPGDYKNNIIEKFLSYSRLTTQMSSTE